MVGAPNDCPFGISADGPNLTDKASSFVKTTTAWVKSGMKVTPDDKLSDRLAICKTCELWDNNGFAGTGSCKQCGCSTQAKLRMATAKCPIDKWGPII
jgi:hypothetical protein